MSNKVNKSIEVLTDFEHIIKRPTIYVGSVKKTEEIVPIIRGGMVRGMNKEYSVGMYKLFDEVFSNSIDEAKRMSSQMKKITVEINPKTNSVSITDTGDGFINGSVINKKSKLSNIETAVSMLRAGSNFDNDEIDETIVGTNGMGVSLVNALSNYFEIETANEKEVYFQSWKSFKPSPARVSARAKSRSKGTMVSFVPNSSVFDNTKWDKEILRSYLLLKKRVLETENKTASLKIDFIWDGEKESINNILSPDWSVKTPIGEILIWEKKEDSSSFSYVNSALCTGIHQKIVLDRINLQLEDSLGHHFYDTLLIFNLTPGIVRFGDQNKTKFVSKREEVEPTISKHIDPVLSRFFRSEIFKKIKKLVDARKKEAELKKIRKEKKSIRIKHSNKYFPPASSRAENLFIVEGLCIDADEEINVWRNDSGIVRIKLSEIEIGDEVLTHKNRYRKVLNKQKKLKRVVSVLMSDETSIQCTKLHKFYVFDSVTNSFYFTPVELINTEIHSLVKSNLNEFIGTLEVVDFFITDDKEYPNNILLEDGSIYTSSNNHKYCLFDYNTSTFKMTESSDVRMGDLFCTFIS